MNKKGYTLIELIGVIVLISLVVLLITTATNRTVKESEKKKNEQCQQSAIMAAQNWLLDNKDKVESEKTLKVEDLFNEGYLGNKDCIEKRCVTITKNTEGDKTVYNYSLGDEC